MALYLFTFWCDKIRYPHYTPPFVWHLAVTFSNFIENIFRCTWVTYGASSIPAERSDVRLAGWYMTRYDNYVAERSSWRSCPTHLSLLHLKNLVLAQLVGTCQHIIFMKQLDHPGCLVPPICQIQNQLLLQLKYLMLAQLVSRWLDITSM